MKKVTHSRLADGESNLPVPLVREIDGSPEIGDSVNVRSAKARLSELLNRVAAGREVVITSGGKAKARLVPVDFGPRHRPFSGTREHLASMPKWKGGPTADEIIRADRDGRG